MEYTQEMYDSGVKPAIGDEVRIVGIDSGCRLDGFEGKTVKILGYSESSEGKDVVTFEHYMLGFGCGAWFKGGIFHPVITHEQLEESILVSSVYNVLTRGGTASPTTERETKKDIKKLIKLGFISNPK